MPTPVLSRSVPQRWWFVPLHVLAVALLQSTSGSVMYILPLLARKRFGANDFETVLISASPMILASLSIFWNDLFRRRSFARYMFIYWLWSCFPMIFGAFAVNYWMLAIPYLFSCLGGAGYFPASGELLRALYPEKFHGRVYSTVWGGSLAIGAVVTYFLGAWLTDNQNAFRIYFPAVVALQLAGVGVFVFLAHASGHLANRTYNDEVDARSYWKRFADPIAQAKNVLKADHTFARYEAAYMTYGMGWMICYAILPIFADDKLHLTYKAFAASTASAYQIAILCVLLPAGLLLDRLGPIRSTGVSFLLLTLYPLGLIWARNEHELLIVSVIYGISHAGASVGWMVGPVALAPSPDKVPEYISIHATMVGIRAKLFQFLGVALLDITHSFTVPFALAAAAFFWSAIQMAQLNKRIKNKPALAAPATEPTAPPELGEGRSEPCLSTRTGARE